MAKPLTVLCPNPRCKALIKFSDEQQDMAWHLLSCPRCTVTLIEPGPKLEPLMWEKREIVNVATLRVPWSYDPVTQAIRLECEELV